MKYILVLLLLSFSLAGLAQEAKKVYLGIGSGINYPMGLIGASLEVQLANSITAFGSVGIGSWGGKVGTGLRVYPSYPAKFAFSLSYSYASGIDNVDLEMDEGFVNGGGAGTSTVNFDLLPSTTVNVSALKHWLIGKQRKNRIGIELGYAVPTATDRYQSRTTLTQQGRTFMNLMQPGGLLLGTSFSLGL